MKKIRIFITDDHAIVRDGLRQLLNGQPDMMVVGEAGDANEALEKVKSIRPDVILLDITMPQISGLEIIHLIRETLPETQVVVFSMHAKESYVQQVLASGALGYVLKASPSKDILDAIRAARRKEYFLSSSLQAHVITKYIKSQGNVPCVRGYDRLSEREQQVFRMVAQGRTTDQIANFLCISSKTVEKHRTSLMNKLDVHDRLELLKYAIKIGVVDPEIWVD
ncbi:MAG: response regulator transcription factor [Syntrophales bacterium]|nr:response regulator transcription factor [Syntrophales bacterium]